MKRKQKRLFLIILVLVFAACAFAWFVTKPRENTTAETTEINTLLSKANITSLNGWATYPDCGGVTGPREGYHLQVDDVKITFQETESLKSAAKSKNYEVSPRDDGYIVRKGSSWDIIVLTENRPDPAIFASIHFDEKPAGFPVGGTVCN